MQITQELNPTKSMLGYADFIAKTTQCTRRNRFVASLIKNAAGLIIFTSLAGLGQRNVEYIQPYLPMMFILHAALFTLYLGKGNFSNGIRKLTSFLMEIPKYLNIGIARITENALPLAVNLALCISLLVLIKLGIQLFFGIPLIMNILHAIPYVNPDAGVHVFKAFLFQVWYVPALFAFISTGLNWLFFDKETDHDE